MSNMMKSSLLKILPFMMTGLLESSPYDHTREYVSEESEEGKSARLQDKKDTLHREKMEKQGCKEYSYGENKTWARNKKNADRKARKKGWIK